jgi:uncharacterized membrane protein
MDMTKNNTGQGASRQNVAGIQVDDQTLRAGMAIGGGLLALLGLSRRSLGGLLMAAVGGGLLYAGTKEHPAWNQVRDMLGMQSENGPQPALSHKQGIRVDKTVFIDRPRSEVYKYWRRLENLPHFMQHLESVDVWGDKFSHWVVKAPVGARVEWDAEIINEVENELIGWRSLPGAMVANAGSVRFTDGPNGNGTQVSVSLKYDPPAGRIGAIVTKLLGEDPDRQVAQDLQNLRTILEGIPMGTRS